MPIINCYYSSGSQRKSLLVKVTNIKEYVAQLLSGSAISLKPEEVTVRLIQTEAAGLIGAVEFELFAHAFEERIQKQDGICLEVRKYIMALLPELKEVRVWLVLSELGHSWEETHRSVPSKLE